MGELLDATVAVRVPATSANLGPGFDALGLALSLHDEVRVRAVAGGITRVAVAGEGAGSLALDERHLVVRAVRAALDQMGVSADGLELACHNRIPHGRGLGSSAAAIVAGVLAARCLVADPAGRLDDAAVLALASALEGHPDNVAACLLGGLTVAWTEAGTGRAVRLEPSADLDPVLLVPAVAVTTTTARRLLPTRVSHRDAVAGAGRAALLVAALTAHPELLLPATEDRLHQDYREPAMPATLALVRALRAAGVPATVSGAGPSVLALCTAPSCRERVAAEATGGWRLLAPGVDRDGARTSTESGEQR